jgi:hypothetical protein
MSVEGKALLAVGKAQGALLKATKDLLKEDPSDGLRAAKWTDKHKTFFHEFADEIDNQLDDGELEAAMRAAGEKA